MIFRNFQIASPRKRVCHFMRNSAQGKYCVVLQNWLTFSCRILYRHAEHARKSKLRDFMIFIIFCYFQNILPQKCFDKFFTYSTRSKYYLVQLTGAVSASVLFSTQLCGTDQHNMVENQLFSLLDFMTLYDFQNASSQERGSFDSTLH